ncbi:MAG: ATPase, T2SS/T4P/T4SS family [Candidatus Ratteibacteria bacterium]|nr:ATPase, T2SS/T4P/T4SS family [Candidatus Ratteibacteria bacterium]
MINKTDSALCQALLNKGSISKQLLDSIIKEAENSKQEIKSLLVYKSIASEEDILKILSEELNLEVVSLGKTSIDKMLIDKIPVKISSYYKFIPFKIENKTLTIAVSYPLSVKAQDEIRTYLGYEVKQVLACENEIIEALKSMYGLGAVTVHQILQKSPKDKSAVLDEVYEEKVEDIEKLSDEPSVIKLVNQIILDAFNKRATDIHIEPYRDKLRLRYRIDGVLYESKVPPQLKNFLKPIFSRIKIMSNLDIVERRLPQDGRAIVKVQNQTLDLRISTLPTPYGESLVIRILPMKLLMDLGGLGIASDDLKTIKKLISMPYGIIFVTGPTGSGKTTTLYAVLNELNTENRKIITIEDPIEYEIENITQIQVAPNIELTFARGLRSILRHDPDVIMVGEVRDMETAEIAMRSALTGHLVFSTLHTNNAASGVTRLIDIGVEPYLITSSLTALVAQRLVRLICQNCKKEDKNQSPEIIKLIASNLNISASEVKIFRGEGCKKCNSTGYYGRTAIYEILQIDEKIREMILAKASSDKIKKVALENGMLSLSQNGWRKVIQGLTTPEEVIKNTLEEQDSKSDE